MGIQNNKGVLGGRCPNALPIDWKRIYLTSAAMILVAIPSLAEAQAFPGASSAAGAQSVPETEPAAGEIIVTAQKRRQNIQDVGVAITALGANNLAALGRQDISGLQGQVPSLQVNSYSPTLTIFNIRGVSQNDFADSQEAPIAFYSDEVYISSLGAISGQTFDLERVEVLRGPQGTLFGRNATGGLVQIITAKPTKNLDGFLTLTGGSYGQFATEGALSGPLSSWLRGRISFSTDNHGGYIENRTGPNLGNAKFSALRVQLAADVGPDGELLFKYERLRNDHEHSGGLYSFVAAKPNAQGLGVALAPNENYYGTGPGADPFGYAEPDTNPFTGSYDQTGYFDRIFNSVTARFTQKFGRVTLTSITNYQDLAKAYGEDTDASPQPVFVYQTTQKLYQVSQETRLSATMGKLTWVAGVYGLHITSHNGYDITTGIGLFPEQTYGGTLTTDNWAVFGQSEYALAPTLTAIVGGRYSSDIKKLDFSHESAGVQDFVFNPTADPGLAKQRFRDWSGKAELQYKPAGGILLYASVNRGTKSGGFGTQAFLPIDPNSLPYKSEVLTNYEGGAKLSSVGCNLTFDLTGFHYNYHNYQAFSLQDLSEFITNHDAWVNGAEIELTARPVNGLSIQAFGTYLHDKLKNITLPFGDVVDRKLPQAPSLSIGGFVCYGFSAGPGELALQTDWKYDSSQYFSTFNAPIDYEPGRVVGNARVTYTIDSGRIELAVFSNNIANRRYRLYDSDLSTSLGLADQSYARPRWIGASVKYKLR